ncbi:hypothetical protein TWF730_002661 [Orbilia blumenaviensis]|uniref:Uncharacterized protein n=1 Tax=Orbilia blumenaviensis TaxID=1796055 RepID=A0AAV9U7K7_9PEZI
MPLMSLTLLHGCTELPSHVHELTNSFAWSTVAPTATIIGNDVNPINHQIQASSPTAFVEKSQILDTAEQQEPVSHLQKRSRPNKKKETPNRQATGKPPSTTTPNQNSELLMYQKMLLQSYEKEQKERQLAAEQEERRKILAAQAENERALKAAREKLEAERRKRDWDNHVQNVLYAESRPDPDRHHWHAVENRLWDRVPSLFEWDTGYNAGDFTLNDFYPGREATKRHRAKAKAKIQSQWGNYNSIIDENDQNDQAFIDQLSGLDNKVPEEDFFAVEPYDLELPIPGALEYKITTISPGSDFTPWEEVKEWHEYGTEKPIKSLADNAEELIKSSAGYAEKPTKPPVDDDDGPNANTILSTASGTTSRNGIDSPGRLGLNGLKITGQSFNRGNSESFETEAAQKISDEPMSKLDESIFNVRRPDTPDVTAPRVQIQPQEEEQKVDSETKFAPKIIDDVGYVSVRPVNENRIEKELSTNTMYNQWAAAWKGPIYPDAEKDWGATDFISELKQVSKSQYGLGKCERGFFDYYGKEREARYCRLKKSGLYVAEGISLDLALKLDVFLTIGCRTVFPNIGCGSRHWYLQQKKVPTTLADGSKAYQDIYIDIRFDLASSSPINAGLGHGGVGLPHVQFAYMLPSELSDNQPPAEREWYYHEFRNAVKLDQNILGNMFTDTRFPFRTAWPKEWVQNDFIAPGTPWGQRKASGNDVPIPASNKLSFITGRQRVILTTKGWHDRVLDRSSIAKTTKTFMA